MVAFKADHRQNYFFHASMFKYKKNFSIPLILELASGKIRVLNLVVINWHKQHAITKWNGVGHQNFIRPNKVCDLFIGMKVKEYNISFAVWQYIFLLPQV